MGDRRGVTVEEGAEELMLIGINCDYEQRAMSRRCSRGFRLIYVLPLILCLLCPLPQLLAEDCIVFDDNTAYIDLSSDITTEALTACLEAGFDP